MRISGSHTDVDFWRMHYPRPPLICLNGLPLENVCEAKSGSDGYVIVERIENGKPVLADVVLHGSVIDRIIVKLTLRGHVSIEAVPERLS